MKRHRRAANRARRLPIRLALVTLRIGSRKDSAKQVHCSVPGRLCPNNERLAVPRLIGSQVIFRN